jgi:inorganic pyrophosphatase
LLSPVANYGFSDIKYINDLREAFLKELENFFVNYHELTGSEA